MTWDTVRDADGGKGKEAQKNNLTVYNALIKNGAISNIIKYISVALISVLN